MKTKKSKKNTASKPTTKKNTTKAAPAKKQAPTTKKSTAVAQKPNETKKSTQKPTGKSTTAGKNSATKSVSTNGELVTVEIRIHSDANAGHLHIKVDTVDGNIVSVGTTHDKFKGKNHPNIPLERNPLGGKEKTYMRRQGTVDREENYIKTKKTGKMTVADHTKAQQIGAKAKQKYLDNQKKNNKKA